MTDDYLKILIEKQHTVILNLSLLWMTAIVVVFCDDLRGRADNINLKTSTDCSVRLCFILFLLEIEGNVSVEERAK